MIWLATLKGQIAVGAMAVLAAWGWLKARDAKIVKKTEAVVVERSEKQGALNAAKSKKAHDAARSPGAAERLLKHKSTCRDCD